MTYPMMGNTPKKVPVSPLTPLGHCSVVYNETLPGGLQTDPATLLIIFHLCFLLSDLRGGSNQLRLNVQDDEDSDADA